MQSKSTAEGRVADESAGPSSWTVPPASISVILVDDDEHVRKALRRELERVGFRIRAYESAEEAIEALRTETFDVLVTDLRLGGQDGLTLLHTCRDLHPRMRGILVSAAATSKDHRTAIELGAVAVLVKPLGPLELVNAIRQAVECENGYRGSVHGLSLVDMLQMFHFARRSVTLHLDGPRWGKLHMRKGELVHAEAPGFTGPAALSELLRRPSGSLRTTPLETMVVSLSGSFDSLLLDALREMDEVVHSEREPDLFADGALELEAEVAQPWTLRAREVVVSELPHCTAWAFDAKGSGAVHLVGEPSPDGARELALDLEQVARRIAPECSVLEAIGSTFAVALVTLGPSRGVLLAVDVALPHAAQRFRSRLSRVATRLQSAS